MGVFTGTGSESESFLVLFSKKNTSFPNKIPPSPNQTDGGIETQLPAFWRATRASTIAGIFAVS